MRPYKSYARHTGAQSPRAADKARSSSRAPSGLGAHEAEADRAAEKASDARHGGAAQGLTSVSAQGGAAGAQAVPGGGRPLTPAERATFEPSFGRDFSGVRVHTDAQAAEAAEDASAAAFTVGNHIVFGAGRYQPETPQGRQLLAHELAHTVQQQQGAHGGGVMQRMPKEEKQGIGSAPPADEFTVAAGVGPEDTYFLFEENSTKFAPGAAEPLLAKLATYTTAVTVEIHGYASGEGDEVYNSNLSAHRAAAIKALLLAKLPPGSKVVLYARGETSAFGELKNNRRAGVKISQGNDSSSAAVSEGALENEAWRLTLPPFGAPPGGRSLNGFDFKLKSPLLTPPAPIWTQPPVNLFPGLGGPQAGQPVQPQPFFNIPPLQGQGVMDWSALSEPFRLRGLRISDRDGDSIVQTWTGTYQFLVNLGFSPKMAASIADIGTAKAYNDFLAREHPTPMDKMDAQWEMYKKIHHPDEFSIPPIPIITPTTLNWVTKKIFKKDINFNF